VIGTGSSAIQAIPLLAEQAEHLTVFQRTPAYSMPAKNAPLTDEQIAAMKAAFPQHRIEARHTHGGVVGAPRADEPAMTAAPEAREQKYAAAWERGTLHALLGCYNDVLLDPDANETVAEFIRNRIRSIAATRSARSGPASTRTTTRPTTARTLRWSTCARRRSSRSNPEAYGPPPGSTSSTRSCSPRASTR
jgi:cyclohexanone monooxygenase